MPLKSYFMLLADIDGKWSKISMKIMSPVAENIGYHL